METEIELKFFVSEEFAQVLEQKIEGFKVLQHSRRQLINVYFDTPDQWLRQHDIGLRIRRTDEVYVQTVKTSGRVMAGLHQRPEYNASHDGLIPDLTKHPEDIWPEGRDLDTLSQELQPLFETNFERTQWLISMDDGSQIELAFDLGQVVVETNNAEDDESEPRTSPIAEVELELKSGQTESLFTLARMLSDQGGLRLGNLSKAARGYRLAQQAPLAPIQSFTFAPLKPDHNLEDTFVQAMEHALSHWHYHEEIYTEAQEASNLVQISALIEIKHAIGLIRQLFHSYADILPRKATAIMRQEFKWLEDELNWLKKAQHLSTLTVNKGILMRKLENRKELVDELQNQQLSLPSRDDVLSLFHSTRYLCIILDMSRWILSRGWQPFLDDNSRQRMTEDALPYAREHLEKHWQEFKPTLLNEQEIDSEHYTENRDPIRYRLYMELIFTRLFSNESQTRLDLLWMDLLHGIDDLNTLTPLEVMLPDFDEEQQQVIERWLHRQQTSTLYAMEQTRAYGKNLQPYWQSYS